MSDKFKMATCGVNRGWMRGSISLEDGMIACASIPSTPLYLFWSATGVGQVVNVECGSVESVCLDFHNAHRLLPQYEIDARTLYLFSRYTYPSTLAQRVVRHRVHWLTSDGTDYHVYLRRDRTQDLAKTPNHTITTRQEDDTRGAHNSHKLRFCSWHPDGVVMFHGDHVEIVGWIRSVS